MNNKYYDRLKSANVDERLSRHIAHLFIRDPLAIYSDIIDVDDKKSTYHFETIQSTNWNNMRFKPPPPKNENEHNIGWRVELRTFEVQITEFENAAFSVFATLLSRAMLYYQLLAHFEALKFADTNACQFTQNATSETVLSFFKSNQIKITSYQSKTTDGR